MVLAQRSEFLVHPVVVVLLLLTSALSAEGRLMISYHQTTSCDASCVNYNNIIAPCVNKTGLIDPPETLDPLWATCYCAPAFYDALAPCWTCELAQDPKLGSLETPQEWQEQCSPFKSNITSTAPTTTPTSSSTSLPPAPTKTPSVIIGAGNTTADVANCPVCWDYIGSLQPCRNQRNRDVESDDTFVGKYFTSGWVRCQCNSQSFANLNACDRCTNKGYNSVGFPKKEAWVSLCFSQGVGFGATALSQSTNLSESNGALRDGWVKGTWAFEWLAWTLTAGVVAPYLFLTWRL